MGRYKELNNEVSFPALAGFERLLIGAKEKLLVDEKCSPDPAEFLKIMGEKCKKIEIGDRKRLTEVNNWSFNFGTGSLMPVALTLGVSGVISKRTRMTVKESVCSYITTEPDEHLDMLKDFYGIEISACTGNARRVTLAKILGSESIRQYLKGRVHFRPSEEASWFHALSSHEPSDQVDQLYAEASEQLKEKYDKALKLSFVVLKKTKVKNGMLWAFWAWKKIAIV
jgi:hypothetical protein